MKDWTKTLVRPNESVMSVIERINDADMQVALIVDDNQRLLGIVTDGDVRRFILRRLPLDRPVTEAMNPTPTTCNLGDSLEHIQAVMTASALRFLPLIDADGRVVGVHANDFVPTKPERRTNPVVLMVGGMGTRLRPLTNDTPKPLLKIGGKPILEIIIDSFVNQGFVNFYLAVNYKADMIKDHFGDGRGHGAKITYIEEQERMGTCGALGLIAEPLDETFLVMNGDLLTTVDFGALLDFHHQHHSVATMAVREYDYQVPFGVINSDGHHIMSIEEKPIQRFFVNAGIYALSPAIFKYLNPGKYMDITDLFKSLIEDKQSPSMFQINEYWLDVGRIDDFERANQEFHGIFGKDRKS